MKYLLLLIALFSLNCSRVRSQQYLTDSREYYLEVKQIIKNKLNAQIVYEDTLYLIKYLERKD